MTDALTSIHAGQPGKVVQIAYLVPDIDAAVAEWLDDSHAGPFFRARFDLSSQSLRGGASHGAIEAAIGFRDDLCIELIEYRGEGPNVFAELLPGRTRGLHHLMLATGDLDADLARHAARGEPVIVDWLVEGFGRTLFVDTRARLGHFTEYGLWAPPVLAAVASMTAAHCGWDGSDPVRPYPSLSA